MNPDLLARILASIRGTQSPPPPAPAMTYADTLAALAGKPSVMVHAPQSVLNTVMSDALGRRGVGGFYDPNFDAVVLSNAAPEDREGVAHEFGHRYADMHPFAAPVQSALATPPAPKTWSGQPNYASANRQEQLAVAFAAAQRIMDHASELDSLWPRDPKTEPGRQDHMVRQIRSGEMMAPGTVAMLNMMVRNPIYAHHPMQNFRASIPAEQIVPPVMAPADAVRQ